MNRPRILVLTAAGKTGLPIATQLLDEGFPVTAFVRREDTRSERLRALGASIVVGSLTDIHDLRRAMTGVQRAYFCTPLEPGALRAAAVFAMVAAEHTLESVVAMSQWLASPHHRLLHTRETWLGDQLLARLPGTAVTTLNPGFFADNDMAGLPFAAQFGLLMLPYGAGLERATVQRGRGARCCRDPGASRRARGTHLPSHRPGPAVAAASRGHPGPGAGAPGHVRRRPVPCLCEGCPGGGPL